DNEHIAPRIFHCTWSPPSLANVEGRPLIIFAGGNGIVYAFERITTLSSLSSPAALNKVWQFDFDPDAPKDEVHRYTSNRSEGPSNIYGMPVAIGNRVYVGGGGDLFWGKNGAWLKCIDARGYGDITTSNLIWSYPLVRHTVSTPAVYGDLVFITDVGRTIHC